MASLLRDLRYSIRMFVQNPGFTAVALLSLALGIGANTTIFSVLNTILLRPFPVKEPDRLVILFERDLKRGRQRNPTFAAFQEWKKESQVFEDMALINVGSGGPVTLTGAEEAVRIGIAGGSPNMFSVLGVPPAIGRSFLPEDIPQGVRKSSTVMISHDFWQRYFDGNPGVLGQTVALEGEKKIIIGVMPPGFWVVPWGKDVDAWWAGVEVLPHRRPFIPVIARLKPGASLEQARAEMDTFARRLEQASPKTNKGWGVSVEPLHEWAVGGYRRTLYLLLGAVGFVLLIACANVANLLLTRAAMRQKEIAVRASLGAGRLRLIRQLLTESTFLAVLGGTLGMLVALWGIEVFVVLAPQWFARTSEISIDLTVFGFTLGLAVLTGILFGLAPAVQASEPDLNESLKEAGGRSTGGGRRGGRNVLVVAEVALAMVLLMGAGLMINSFVRLQSVGLGFNPENLLTANILLAGPNYWRDMPGIPGGIRGDMKRVTPQGALFFQELLRRVEALPGVVSASLGQPGRASLPRQFRIAGQTVPSPDDQSSAIFKEVSSGFFRTMGIPLLRGRSISERDTESSPWVVVINEAFARNFFPDEDPIGKVMHLSVSVPRLNFTVDEDRPRQIVGVVGDVRYWGPRGTPSPVMYGSYFQRPREYPGGRYIAHLWKDLVIRTETDPMSFAPAVRRIVADLDKDQAVFDVMSMEQAFSGYVAPQRFWMRLFGIFAALAVLLAMVGIYGVMSYSVSRRTHEIGVRMAMGAQRRDVLKLVLRQGLKLTLIGVAIGVSGALALTRLIARFLYDVKPTDPLTLVAVSLLLTAVALGACYIPARRASNVDPMVALRHE